MPLWFSLRGPDDDAAAILVSFCEALVPDDLFVQDMRPQNHSYQGSTPFSSTTLVREEPGAFQERDIALLLQRIFAPDEIYLNPKRITDGEEIADLIVASPTHVIFVQAKDSPNTEKVLQNTLDRKRATALKSLRKAVGQMRGAFRYLLSKSPMRMTVGGVEVALSLNGRSQRRGLHTRVARAQSMKFRYVMLIRLCEYAPSLEDHSPTLIAAPGSLHAPPPRVRGNTKLPAHPARGSCISPTPPRPEHLWGEALWRHLRSRL